MDDVKRDTSDKSTMPMGSVAMREMTAKEILAGYIKELHQRAEDLQQFYNMLPERPTYEQNSALRRLLLTTLQHR